MFRGKKNRGSKTSVRGSDGNTGDYRVDDFISEICLVSNPLMKTPEAKNALKNDGFNRNCQGAIPRTYNTVETNKYKKQSKLSSIKYSKRNNRGPEQGWYVKCVDYESKQSAVESPPHTFSFPFYYIVPENPCQINIFSPGKYLVIPQNNTHCSLRTIRHPKELDKNEKRETEENAECNPVGGEEKEGSIEKETRKVDDSRKSSDTSLPLHETEQEANWRNEKAEPLTEEVKEEVVNTEEDDGKPKEELSSNAEDKLPDDLLASLMNQLPYLEADTLRMKWSTREPGQTVELFVKELNNRRYEEVYDRVLSALPMVPLTELVKEIPDIMGADNTVEEFIETAKLKARTEIVQRLCLEYTSFSEDEINSLCEDFKDQIGVSDVDSVVELVNAKMANLEREKRMKSLQQIVNIFPDIDVEYALSELENFDKADLLNGFINDLLESGNYPKAAHCDPISREQQKLWNYYVTNFSVTKYLDKVPDPKEFFSGSSVGDQESDRDIAMTFLEKRYPDLDSFQLDDVFRRSNESIWKTCELLDKNYLPDTTIDERLRSKRLTEYLLQEIAFTVHKKEILKRVEEEKERRQLEIQLAEEENSFFECLVCYDSGVIPSEVVPCPEGHIICRHCLIGYIETSFAEGKYLFPCLSESCNTEYTLKTLEKFLKADLFSKIEQRRAAEEVDKAEVPGLEKCPSCHFAYVPAPEEKVFICLNENCNRETCRLCKEPNHIPLSCKEIEKPQDLQARLQVEEVMTKRLVRSCPTCSKKFIKLDGCNKICCPCGTNICYICLQVVSDYSHFNGMGGTEFNKCPLYSDNTKLHFHDVVEAGTEEMDRIRKENPEVNFVYDPRKMDEYRG